jgi:hypothetical protein
MEFTGALFITGIWHTGMHIIHTSKRHCNDCILEHACALEEALEEGKLILFPSELTERHHLDLPRTYLRLRWPVG